MEIHIRKIQNDSESSDLDFGRILTFGVATVAGLFLAGMLFDE